MKSEKEKMSKSLHMQFTLLYCAQCAVLYMYVLYSVQYAHIIYQGYKV